MKRHALRDAIRVALVACAATATAAHAQTPSAPEGAPPTTLDRIEVTGSRIRQVDVETAAPVLVISREDIQKQGFNSVADILQNITSAGSPAVSRTAPLAAGEAVGGAYIDLRNLGPNRTLVLVNGKRLGITTSGLQDISQIPAAMIERIEVLKDGASTLYGSDAIAGVINLITRRNLDGMQASVYGGQYSQGDGQRTVVDLVAGFGTDRGSVTVGAEYTEEDPVWAIDRWFSANRFPMGEGRAPRPGGESATTQYGRLIVPGRGNFTLRRETPGLDPRDLDSYRALDDTDFSLPVQQSTLLAGIERKSVFVNIDYALSDRLRFAGDMLYTDRASFSRNAGYPYSSQAFDTPMSIDSYYNPVGNQSGDADPTEVHFTRRGWEVPRENRLSLSTYRFSGALSGYFELGGRSWDWDVGYLYNQNKGVQVGTGNLNLAAVRMAVGPSFLNSQGVVQCGTPDNPIPLGTSQGECTPWNPLLPLGYGGPGDGSAMDPAVRQFIFPVGQAVSMTKTQDYFANLTGTLATMPAGDLAIAVGVEHRKEYGEFSPDALAQSGGSTDLAAGPTSGGYSLDEVYAEVQVPLLADVPFAEELTLSAATRYSNYDTFGDTTNSKLGLKWKPVDSVLVRSTWAEGFRAPDVSNLYGGASQTFSFYTDPCDTEFGAARGNARCLQDVPVDFRQPANDADGVANGPGTQTPIPFVAGANPDLTPETSESVTLGVVFSPSFAPGLNLSLDWWTIRIENTIVPDTETQVLDDCYLRGIEARCNASTGSRFVRDADGQITSFITTPINVGHVETEGFDFDVNYRRTTDWGTFSASWLSTYISKLELKTDDLEDNPPQQLNGLSVGTGANFRVRSNLNLGWERGSWGISWGMRYYSGLKERCNFDDLCSLPDYSAPWTGGQRLRLNERPSTTFHDVQVRYQAPWNASISLGANNVFERYGPPMFSQPNSGYSYYGGYDIGRFLYLKYQQKF